MDLWSPECSEGEEDVLEMTKGGACEVSVASTGWGIKDRFAEREARGIQASRFGWKSERRKGMGVWFVRVR